MIAYRQLLIDLVNKVLFNEAKIAMQSLDTDARLSFFNEVKAHRLSALIYEEVAKLPFMEDVTLLSQMKTTALLESLYQLQQIDYIIKLFKSITDKNIQIVLLKGIQLRELYPKPELRTMGDVDILVREDQFEQVKELLLSKGYVGNVDNGVHLQFIKKGSIPIEVHWRLTNEGYHLQFPDNYEKEIWERIEPFNVYGIPLYVLSKEDNILFLSLHMAEHMLDAGFGLRHILDFAVFVYANPDILWDKVLVQAKRLRIDKFILSICSICVKLFNIQAPDFIKSFGKQFEKSINTLIDEIFESGVFGKKSHTRIMANKIAQYQINKNADNLRIFAFDKQLLYNSFPYAKKSQIFLPVAWCHRVIKMVIKKCKTLVNIYKSRMQSGEHLSVRRAYQQRIKLIKWLKIN